MIHKRTLWLVFLGLCSIFGILLLTNSPEQMKDKEIYQISYIHRGKLQEDSKQVILKGMEQAAYIYNIEFSAVSSGTYADAGELIDLIGSEVKGGADAILIDSIYDEDLGEEIKNINAKLPVIEVSSCSSGKEDNKSVRIHADDYSLGKLLGGKALKYLRPGECVTLIQSGTEYSDVMQRYLGVKEVLEESGVTVNTVKAERNEELRISQFNRIIEKQGHQHFVAFDSNVLEQLGQIKEDDPEHRDFSIYGIGNTNKVISYLENDVIQLLGVSNEYSIGYLSIRSAVDKLEGRQTEEYNIGYKVIEADELYTDENQRLLFPLVQ